MNEKQKNGLAIVGFCLVVGLALLFIGSGIIASIGLGLVCGAVIGFIGILFVKPEKTA